MTVQTINGPITLCSTEVKCTLCTKTFKSKQAFYNHTQFNGCIGMTDLKCFCGQDLQNHYCKMLGTCRCSFCSFGFRNLEAGINHCMSNHKDGNYWSISKFLIYDDLTFVNSIYNVKPEAQCAGCEHHWNYGQFENWWKTGDSQRRRMLTRKVLASDHYDCGILEMISVRGKFICWYHKPQKHNLRMFEIQTKIGKREVYLDINQNDFRKIYSKIEPLMVTDAVAQKNKCMNEIMKKHFPTWKSFVPEAQGLFDFNVNHTIDIQPIIDQLSTLAKNTFTGENLKKVLSLVAKIGICYVSNWNINVLSLAFLDFFLSFDIPLDNVDDALKLVARCAPIVVAAFLAPRAQSIDEEFSKETFTAIATMVSVLFGTVVLKNVPKSSQVDEFVTSATKFGNLMRAMDNSWKGLGKLVGFLYDYCYEYFTGYSRDIGEATKFIDGVQEWSLEVAKISSNDVVERIQVDAVLCRQIERLYLQGVTFVTRSAHLKLEMPMRRAIENCHRIISALNDKVSKSGAFCSGPKVEPLIVQLWGDSGVGKSGMMYLLSGDILKTEDILSGGDGTVSDDWANQIYPRNVEQEFFDGYRNQLIVLYDDFGQMRDSQAKPNIEFMEMIRFGNLAPMCLHMAALEQKDKTYFSSKCVLLSSNTREYQIESLISRDAFNRRIDLSVEVSVKPEWRKEGSEKLDVERVITNFKSPLTPEIYQCRLWRNGQPCPIWISYESLQHIVCTEYAKKMNRHFELTTILSDYMKVPLQVDLSQIKEQLDKKFKVETMKHFTLGDLIPNAQSLEDEFHDCIAEQNCVPTFPENLQKSAKYNHYRWNRKVEHKEIKDETNCLVYSHEAHEHNWSLRFVDFQDALFEALEVCDGEWSRVVKFLSQHLSFLSLKTQIAFARSEFKQILSEPEKAIDFFHSGDVTCQNSKCWHPDLKNMTFGFQKGCEKDLLKYILNRTQHRDVVLYDCFFVFQITEQSQTQKFTSNMMTQLKTIRDGGVEFLKVCANWCAENTGIVTMLSYFALAFATLYGCYSASKTDEMTEYQVAKARYEHAYMVYHDALKGLKNAEIDLTHKHEGLPLGTFARHSHKCEKCGMSYFHGHTIKTEEESMKYQHICPKCRKVESEFQSGDNVTTHQQRPKVENSQSGDNVTTHHQRPKVENSQSGDNITTHNPRPVVQDNFKNFLEEIMEESNVDGQEFLQHHVSKTMHSDKEITSELASDPNAMTLSRKVYVNTYMISTRASSGEDWKMHVNCVFVRGRTAITVGHLKPVLALRSSGEIKIDGPFKPEGYVIPISELRFKILEDVNGEERDLMILIFPSVVHDHQDIIPSIADSETMGKFTSIPSMLITPTIIKERNIFNQRFATATAVDNEVIYIDRNAPGGTRKMRKHYQYIMNTTNGDCGSLLVALSNYLPKKIIGVHVAGDAAGKGYAIPLNVRDIVDALKDVPLEAQISLDLSRYEKKDAELSSVPQGDFTPALKSIAMIASPSKTALRRSAIYGEVLEPISAPAVLSRRVVLSDGTLHDPVLAGLKKTGKIPPFMETKLIKAAVNDVLRIHQTNDRTRKRVLTNEEALSGVLDDIYSNPLNRGSSPGFPWVLNRSGKGKMKWTADENGEYKMNEELKKAIDEREEMALRNERFPTIWIDTLKDERRPLEKVRVGKTRVFAAGPMDFVVCARKYFLGFCAHLAEHRIDNEVAVGINPYSYDWTQLAVHLKKKGDRVVAGDFGNFDGTLILQILEEIGNAINEWYDDGDDNKQIRKILWKELINSIHIEADNIYFWTHGHPSGHPLTAILNSLYNSVVCRIVFVMCARKAGQFVTMKDFNENVSMISYGDDNVLNISERVTDWFNQHTMSEVFSEIGMEYTDELKSSAVDALPFRKLEDVSFLKRKFKFDEERHCYNAPLEYGVCMEMVNWIRGELDPEDACCVNCQTSAMELSLHGRKIFEDSTKLIKQACLKRMVKQPMILTYDEYIEQFENSYGRMMEIQILG